MKLGELFEQKECVFSIEVFPPKRREGDAALFSKLAQMKELHPDFISVTYGAGGSAFGSATCSIAAYLKNELGVEPLAHLTGLYAERGQVEKALAGLRESGVQNVLALRGDRREGEEPRAAFSHASDLAGFIHAHGDFYVAGACYPEGHPESETLRGDISNLKRKLDAGTGHLITQLFFDNGCFYRLLNMIRKAGYTVPVQAGVMPIVSLSQVQRTVALSAASMPAEFTRMLSRYAGDEASLYEAGIEYAVRQLRDLIESGADGIHLYAMNRPEVARRVYDGIRDLLPGRQDPCV